MVIFSDHNGSKSNLVILVDQHAAHERVRLEELTRGILLFCFKIFYKLVNTTKAYYLLGYVFHQQNMPVIRCNSHIFLL